MQDYVFPDRGGHDYPVYHYILNAYIIPKP